MNVNKLLLETVKKYPSKKAICFKDTDYSYEEINNISNNLAKHLQNSGIKKADTIAVILPNCPEFAFIYFAAMKLGAIFMPIDQKLEKEEINYLLKKANVKSCFVYDNTFEKIENENQQVKVYDITDEGFKNIIHTTAKPENIVSQVDESETALYLHTSGTTNKQKIAKLSYSNLDCYPQALTTVLAKHKKAVLGIIMPMSHISGPIILNALVYVKCQMVIVDRINPIGIFENISKHKITHFHAVPPVFNLMLKSELSGKYDTSSLDFIAMMGTSVPVSLMKAFKDKFPHVTVLQGYGLTETSPLITLTKRKDADKYMSSIGTPVNNAEVKVIDNRGNEVKQGEPGELIVKGPMVMKGYLDAPELNKSVFKNGYFYTGDIVKYDDTNYFYHLGRKDDLIVLANGMNVYPAEVLNIILRETKILEASVIGVFSGKENGNIMHACIVPVPGQEVSKKEIRNLCHKHLANFKVPAKISIMESLPKTSSGKTDTKRLKNTLSDN